MASLTAKQGGCCLGNRTFNCARSALSSRINWGNTISALACVPNLKGMDVENQEASKLKRVSSLQLKQRGSYFLWLYIWSLSPLKISNSGQCLAKCPKERAGPPGVIGTALIMRLKVEAVATSPSRSTRLCNVWWSTNGTFAVTPWAFQNQGKCMPPPESSWYYVIYMHKYVCVCVCGCHNKIQ